MTRRRALLMLPVVFVAALTVAVARRQPEWALAGSPGALALEVSAGLAVAAAGLVIMARGPDAPSGALLYATGITWLVAEWDNPGAPGTVAFTLGMVFAYSAPALAAHALLVHGSGHLASLAERLAVAAGYVGLTALAGLAATAVHEPSEAGCGTCPVNLLALTNAPEAASSLERWGLRIGIAALAAVVLLSAWRGWRVSPAFRRTIVPVLVPGAGFLVIVASSWCTCSPAAGRDSTASMSSCAWPRASRSSPWRSVWRGSGSPREGCGTASQDWWSTWPLLSAPASCVG